LKCQELVEEVDDLKIRRDVYKSLGMSYKTRGEFQKAARAFEIRGIISDSLQQIERAEMAERLEVEYRTAEKDKEIAEKQLALLRSEKQKAKDDLMLSNRNNWIVLLLAGLLASFLIGLIIITRNKRKAEQEKGAAIIAEQESKINEIIEARELERERISRDLHDGICQTLTALRMQQRDIQSQIAQKDPKSAELLQSSIETTSLVYNEARELSHQLLPAMIEKVGLVQSLNQLLEFSIPKSSMSYEFDSLIPEDANFKSDLEISVYRILQELITNAIKHAKASVLSVQLYERNDNLILIVSDNGKGLSETDQQKKGAGLINIEQRTQSLNGTFHLEVDNGLTVTVRLPIS
jgi:two-component system NarL family sensor kinase